MVDPEHISHEAYRKARSHEYRLSLSVGVDGMAYMVADGGGRVLYFRNFKLQGDDRTQLLKRVLSSDDRLLHHYKSTRVGLCGYSFTLIPERLFNSAHQTLYLGCTSRTDPCDLVRHDTLSFNASRLVYALNAGWVSILKSYFPSARMSHRVTALLQGWRKQAESGKGRKVYLNAESGYFTIAFFEESSLVFANRFKYQTAGDFIYYTLMTYDRFGLSPETVPCILSGQIVEDSDVYKKLYSYIRTLQFMPLVSHYDFPSAFRQLPHHTYFDLFSLNLCE